MNRTITPGSLAGTVLIPASKSQTIRALLIAAAAEGISILRNPLDSADARSCAAFCQALGAQIIEHPDRWEVAGINIASGIDKNTGSNDTPIIIDAGNSGTTIYLGAAIAAATGKPIVLTGDEQIRNRPISNLLAAYADLGVTVTYDIPQSLDLAPSLAPGCPPVMLKGPMKGGATSIACPTSQYLSSLLLAAPLAAGPTEIEVTLLNEAPYAVLTENWLKDQHITFSSENMARYHFPGRDNYSRFDRIIPGDYSSASFFFCAAAVTGSTITIKGLLPDDPQGDRQVLSWLEQMGCTISWKEEVLTITGAEQLQGITIDLNSAPDALPVLAVTGCFAQGETRLLNVAQARIKETDRIDVMHRELEKLGADITELEDGLIIKGTGTLQGGIVYGHGDHRVVMALAVAALAAEKPVTIEGTEAAAVTFPAFFELLNSLR